MNEIVIIGGGGHAKSIISILKRNKNLSILGYVDIINKGSILDCNYLGDDRVLEKIRNKHKKCSAVIGIGILNLSDINKRIIIQKKLESLEFDLTVIISPSAVINENVKLGKATIVFDHVVIEPDTEIGENVIINTKSIISHDCQIGDYVHVAPGVTICGGVVVGNKSFIGAGVTIVPNINIGENCIIGAGAVVTQDCLKPGKYVGVPARSIE